MSKVHVLRLPGQIGKTDMALGVAVVIDVLRATSSIVTALSSGSTGIIPAANREEALKLRESYPDSLLCGEEQSKIIPGFDLGNSPRDFTPENVQGKKLILTTSNGTKAILGAKAQGASAVFMCSFLNIDAVAKTVACEASRGDAPHDEASRKEKGVFVICSGSHGEFSLEDFVCAGALADRLANKGLALEESATEARHAYFQYRDDILQALHDSQHGKYLEAIGYGADLPYCARVSVTSIVPYLADHVIQEYAAAGH
ncbi:MAG TPA: 2-phosphosulfolactate phosphatase [Firmicutes bacterium]|nr:2-phosphosulfolactate phosphatase [Candidatus Fermentithermobacillaceae bacterium]